MIAQWAAFHNTQFNSLVAVTRRVNFLEACSFSKEISPCDNHSGETPRCLIAEEVSKVQLFTSSAAGNVAKNRVIFATSCIHWLIVGSVFQ